MKLRIFYFVVLLGVLALPRAASAADPEFQLMLDNDFRVIATLSDPNAQDNRIRWCRIEGQSAIVIPSVPGSMPVEIGRVRVGDDQPSNPTERFIIDLLASRARVQCTKEAQADARTQADNSKWFPATVKQLSVKNNINAIQSPIAALSPGIDWFAFRGRFREALLNALGTPTRCTVTAVYGIKDLPCSVGLLDDADGRLRLDVAGVTDVRRISLYFSNSQSLAVTFDVAQCTFHATGNMPYIIAGAMRQTLFLESPRPECVARLDRLSALDVSGVNPISVGVRARSRLDEGKRIELSNVPAALATGELTFTLKANGDAVGTAIIQVLDKISAGDLPRVRVTYNLHSALDVAENFSARTNDGIAVVQPKSATPNGDSIQNTVSILIKPPLPSTSDNVSTFMKDASPWRDDEKLGPPSDRSRRSIWRISPGRGKPLLDACSTLTNHYSCELTSGPGMIAFSLKDASANIVEAKLELVEVVRVIVDNPTTHKQEARYDERSLIEVNVKLADSARVESVPLPIRDRLYVDCRGANTNVMNGEMRAIDDDDVVNGTCALVLLPVPVGKPGPAPDLGVHQVKESKFDRDKLLECQQYEKTQKKCVNDKKSDSECTSAMDNLVKCRDEVVQEAWRTQIDKWIDYKGRNEETRRLNPFFGPQRLIVTLRRDGNEIATKRWDVNPDQPAWIGLPRGTDTQRGSLYTVEVRVAARPTSEVFYANATTDNSPIDNGDSPQTELHFSAQLRSRGMFGFRPAIRWYSTFIGLRVYATIPVQLVGFRFPPATSELRASSDPVSFQYMTPRTGLLGVIEPWNYDTGQNPWPLNPAISGGILALELTKPRISISTLLGIQFKTPLLNSDSGQLTSSLALGMFWEHGIQEKENRFLLTFGANVLSLFAGK